MPRVLGLAMSAVVDLTGASYAPGASRASETAVHTAGDLLFLASFLGSMPVAGRIYACALLSALCLCSVLFSDLLVLVNEKLVTCERILYYDHCCRFLYGLEIATSQVEHSHLQLRLFTQGLVGSVASSAQLS
jgi:hypothetical protein